MSSLYEDACKEIVLPRLRKCFLDYLETIEVMQAQLGDNADLIVSYIIASLDLISAFDPRLALRVGFLSTQRLFERLYDLHDEASSMDRQGMLDTFEMLLKEISPDAASLHLTYNEAYEALYTKATEQAQQSHFDTLSRMLEAALDDEELYDHFNEIMGVRFLTVTLATIFTPAAFRRFSNSILGSINEARKELAVLFLMEHVSESSQFSAACAELLPEKTPDLR